MPARIRVAPVEQRTMDGVVFASKREMHRYMELKTSYKAGIIRDLELQPRFPLIVNGVKVCVYVADFAYYDLEGRKIIEDSKGPITERYRIKKKLFEALNPGLRIVEI